MVCHTSVLFVSFKSIDGYKMEENHGSIVKYLMNVLTFYFGFYDVTYCEQHEERQCKFWYGYIT